MRACPKCASQIVEEARFCPYCGASLMTALPGIDKLGAVAIIEEEAPSTVADPFSHTAPADPEELERVRAMIAGQSSEPPIPVRERQRFGTTKPLVAVDDDRTEQPPGAARKNLRERTLESSAVPDGMMRALGEQERVTPSPSTPTSGASSTSRGSASSSSPVPAPSSAAASIPAVARSSSAAAASSSSSSPSAPAISPRAATTAAPSFVVGSGVRVLWSDGNAYPAVVTQMAPGHALVRFQNGATHWVELRFIVQS